jgi:hypothetical protein
VFQIPRVWQFQAGGGSGGLPPIGPNPGGGGGLPLNDLDDDGDVVGMGDLGLRFFLRPKQLEWSFMEGKKNFTLMPLVEFTVPTATKDVLGGETFVVSPGVAIVFDLSGLYLMPEMQPVYDFEEDEFSFWIAPEVGKILRDGTVFYAKPGWGVDNSEDGDREFTFEVGFRYFM